MRFFCPVVLPRGERQTITIKGSDTMVQLGQRWAELYMKAHPDVTIQVTGGGSGNGIAALIDGTTQICQASRAMKDCRKGKSEDRREILMPLRLLLRSMHWPSMSTRIIPSSP